MSTKRKTEFTSAPAVKIGKTAVLVAPVLVAIKISHDVEAKLKFSVLDGVPPSAFCGEKWLQFCVRMVIFSAPVSALRGF